MVWHKSLTLVYLSHFHANYMTLRVYKYSICAFEASGLLCQCFPDDLPSLSSFSLHRFPNPLQFQASLPSQSSLPSLLCLLFHSQGTLSPHIFILIYFSRLPSVFSLPCNPSLRKCTALPAIISVRTAFPSLLYFVFLSQGQLSKLISSNHYFYLPRQIPTAYVAIHI